MVQDTYRNLMQAADNNAYMSIAVNSDGNPVVSGFVPWERTVTAFNMKTPKITLAASDLHDINVLNALKHCKLTGCYIFDPLNDYSFLADFEKIEDLFICNGNNIKDLSFVTQMDNLFLFYLENAVLPDLKPLIDVYNRGKGCPAKCMGFYRCIVTDTSSLLEANFILSELLIWPASGDSRDKWKSSRIPGVFRFYDWQWETHPQSHSSANQGKPP